MFNEHKDQQDVGRPAHKDEGKRSRIYQGNLAYSRLTQVYQHSNNLSA